MSEPLFTTVYSSLNAWETHLARAALESEGIEAFVDGEHHAGANWLYTNALGGVSLRVPTEDAERAARIIADAMQLDSGESEKKQLEPKPGRKLACPSCGSHNLRPAHWPKLAVIASYLLLGLPFFFRDQWKCADCGKGWRGK